MTRVLGVDYGDRHVGLALSDPLRITAQPLASYEMTGRDNVDKQFFQGLVAKHDIGEIVLGHPLRMDGSAGSRSEKTQIFAAWLGKAVNRPVTLVDERLTTRQALRTLEDEGLRGRKRKDWEDRIAAVIILSTYLESKRGTDHGPEVG